MKTFLICLLIPGIAFADVSKDAQDFADFIAFIMTIPFVGPYVPYVILFIGIASPIAALPFLPKGDPKSDKLLSRIWYRVRLVLLEMPAMNIGAAKNAK